MEEPGSTTKGHVPALVVRDPFDVTWRERVSVLGGVSLVVLALLTLGLVYARAGTLELVGLIPVSFFAAGKFLPLWGISGKSNFGPYELGLVIWILDTFTVVMIVYAIEGFYRIKPLKRALDKVQTNASLVLAAYPRMRRAAVIGIVIFVLFPVAGTGAVGAAFIGVLLGMHRYVLIGAVSLGGCTGGMLMAFLASNFGSTLQRFQDMQSDPTVKYLFIAGVVALLALLLFGIQRAYKKALAVAREQAAQEH